MKLNKLLEISSNVRDWSMSSDLKLLGAGVHADVHAKGRDQHELDAVMRTARGEEDNTSIWLKLIHDIPELNMNPWCPKVREHDGNSIIMERLRPYESEMIAPEIYTATWDRTFNIPFKDISKLNANLEYQIESFTREYGIDKAHGFIMVTVLDWVVERPNQYLQYVADEDLISMVNILHDNARQFGRRKIITDIHSGNLMWRMTGTMPHLVITDPLAG